MIKLPSSLFRPFLAALLLAALLLAALLLAAPLLPGAFAQQSSGSVTTGPFVRMVRHNDGSRTVTAKSEFDPNSPINLGKTQTVSTYDPDGALRLKRVYQLNQYGKPETFIIYDGNGRALVEGTFEYDFQHRLQEENLYELPSKRLLRRQVHNYTAGTQGTVKTTNLGALPPELLRWMDPDGNVAGVKSADSNGTSRAIWHRGPGSKSETENDDKKGNKKEGSGFFGRLRKRN